MITGSSSLLAESIHSVADSSNQGLLVLGGRQAKAPPDQLHQFGHGRVRYFWAFVVAVVLFTLGGLFSVYEGYHKIRDPHEIDSPAVAIVILVLAALLRGLGAAHGGPPRDARAREAELAGATSASPAARSSPCCCWRTRARCSVCRSRCSACCSRCVTGEPVFDGIGTLMIGLLLLCIAVVLAREMRSLLIGEAASPELQRSIEAEFEGTPGVRRVIHTLTQHLGPDEVLIAAKLEFEPELTMLQLVDAINESERRVRVGGAPNARIYVEPDVGPPESVVDAAPQ